MMAGFDKYQLMVELESQGWTNEENWKMKPPPEFWQNAPKLFHVYEATELVDLFANVTRSLENGDY